MRKLIICLLVLCSEFTLANDKLEKVYEQGGISALREFLRPRTVDELRNLLESKDEQDLILFVRFAKLSSDAAVENNKRDEPLEKLFFEGLGDPRPGFMAADDLYIASPRAICAINLSKITGYDDFLRKSEGKKYKAPLFSINEDIEIKKLKTWYENTYLSGLNIQPGNDEFFDDTEKDFQHQSDSEANDKERLNMKIDAHKPLGQVEKKISIYIILMYIISCFLIILAVTFIVRRKIF